MSMVTTLPPPLPPPSSSFPSFDVVIYAWATPSIQGYGFSPLNSYFDARERWRDALRSGAMEDSDAALKAIENGVCVQLRFPLDMDRAFKILRGLVHATDDRWEATINRVLLANVCDP